MALPLILLGKFLDSLTSHTKNFDSTIDRYFARAKGKPFMPKYFLPNLEQANVDVGMLVPSDVRVLQ